MIVNGVTRVASTEKATLYRLKWVGLDSKDNSRQYGYWSAWVPNSVLFPTGAESSINIPRWLHEKVHKAITETYRLSVCSLTPWERTI